MVVPLAARLVAAVAGGLLVLAAWASVTETLIVSRSVGVPPPALLELWHGLVCA